MELKDTVDLMLSDDWKDRLKAEYWQTKIRYEKLHKLIVKEEAGTNEFDLLAPYHWLMDQETAMGNYLYKLECRAEVESIDLNS